MSRIPLVCLLAMFTACAVPPPEEGDDEEEESFEESEEAVGEGTVEQAMSNSCSTTSIRPLSQQIIDEMRCIDPDGFTALPELSNVTYSTGVFPYLIAPARDALVKAAQSKPSTNFHINSMFRTVAQQYMIRRWYEQGRCGISAAATPGNSNHETGLAVDIANNSTWRNALESRGFDWLGPNDPPHFDYEGAGAVSQRGFDVLAFQRLWNRNHPDDIIAEDGDYGPQTRSRIQKSPAQGFDIGADCEP
ncbi:MAG: hypothetical protein HOW73_32645 [Polyangiaceae bacterium]|nr:hypothetical protein [Polyangiaceae bacterium]